MLLGVRVTKTATRKIILPSLGFKNSLNIANNNFLYIIMVLQKNEDSREITRGEMENVKKRAERGILQCASGRGKEFS
jgi:hypothetical protein